MAATPTPKAAAATMMPMTTSHRRCQGGPDGRTGVPQAVQNWLPGGSSLPHPMQYLTIRSPGSYDAPLTYCRLNSAVRHRIPWLRFQYVIAPLNHKIIQSQSRQACTRLSPANYTKRVIT